MYDFDESAYWLEPDFVLADLVATLVNGLGLPIGVTLFVKGMVISGILTSEHEYLQALSDTFNDIANKSLRPTNGSVPSAEPDEDLFDFTMLAETDAMPPDDALDEDDDIPMPSPVRHVHMRDVHILTPNPMLSFQDSLMPIMRLRLTAIDGWLIGQAVDTEPLDDEDLNGDSKEILH